MAPGRIRLNISVNAGINIGIILNKSSISVLGLVIAWLLTS